MTKTTERYRARPRHGRTRAWSLGGTPHPESRRAPTANPSRSAVRIPRDRSGWAFRLGLAAWIPSCVFLHSFHSSPWKRWKYRVPRPSSPTEHRSLGFPLWAARINIGRVHRPLSHLPLSLVRRTLPPKEDKEDFITSLEMAWEARVTSGLGPQSG